MIYFMEQIDVENSPIKIGYTRDVNTLYRRIRDLQAGNPNVLQVLAVVSDGELELEQSLHRKFQKHHYFGGGNEWYNRTEEIMEYITKEGSELR